MARSPTRCKHCSCDCEAYVVPTSKWSKGRCKRCNHSASVHDNVVIPDVSFYVNKTAAPPKWNPSNPITAPPTAAPSTNKTKHSSSAANKKHSSYAANNSFKNTYSKNRNDTANNSFKNTDSKNRNTRSMTSTNNNDTAITLYKMYFDSKGIKASTPQQLQAFGKTVGIPIKWSEANTLMKKDANESKVAGLTKLWNNTTKHSFKTNTHSKNTNTRSITKASKTSYQKQKTFIKGNKNGWKQKTVDKWSNNDVLHWINNMSINNMWGNKLMDEIRNSGCNGNDIVSLKSAQDIAEAFDIINNESLCRNIWNKIKTLKGMQGNDASTKCSNNNRFSINVCSQDKCITLKEKVTKKVKVRDIAKLYKSQSGVRAQLNDIHLYSHSKLLAQWKTLEQVGIVDEKHLITVKFGTNGAADLVYGKY